MCLNQKNWCVALIVFCLVLLQVFQPFIHAHIDAKQTVHQSGFHVGGEHEESVSAEHFDHHSLSNTSHTVSVGSAIKKDIDTDLVADAIAAIIISFFFIQALQLVQRLTSATPPALKESLKRQLPTTRAPPKP